MSDCRKLIESLLCDLRLLSTEAKKKHPHVKEAAETGVVKVRNIASSHTDNEAIANGLTRACQEVLHPLLMGCSSKNPKLVQICLQAIQKLVAHKVVDAAACSVIVNELWTLMECECEELRVLQTITLMAGSLTVVRGHLLARCIVLCFRLNFAKEPTVINTASASVRQLVGLVFDRTTQEDSCISDSNPGATSPIKGVLKSAPPNLKPAAADAYMLFQDMCLLVNADPPVWLVGMTEMTRTLGLELMESTLVHYSSVFNNHVEFQFLLKEQVCPLVIKLFSPSLKYIQVQSQHPNSRQEISPQSADRPYFPIAMRLLRLVSVLITKYYQTLVTESEIFLTLILKFLDSDKLSWQRALALEVLHRIVTKADLMKCICENYDMKLHATKIVQQIVNGISGFIQSSFLNRDQSASSVNENDNQLAQSQPGFLYRSVWIPLCFISAQSTPKSLYLELVDKHEAPPLADGYCLSLAYTSLLDVTISIRSVVDDNITSNAQLCTQMVNSTHCGLMASFALLLEASADENITESLLKSLAALLTIACDLNVNEVREGVMALLCKAALPPNYMLKIMASQVNKSGVFVCSDSTDQSDVGPSQVVAVSTPCPTPNISQNMSNAQVMLTAKNLQTMRCVLETSQLKGQKLQESWNILLSTIQHLTWMLGVRPSPNGGLESGSSSVDSSTVLTTAVMTDLPLLTNMINKLFTSTRDLDEVALHQVIAALCQQSSECMHVASQQFREPSLFPLAKMIHTTIDNLWRLQIIWKPVTGHLLEVCSHQFNPLREWGSTAITNLINSAFDSDELPEMKLKDLHHLLLSPLAELCDVPFEDVRKKQLDCLMHILHSKGQVLDPYVWPNVIAAVGSVVVGDESLSEGLIRQGHDALQLLITDLLICLPVQCIGQLIEVDAKFGAQNKELNISLSSVGQLWTISDYLYRNRCKMGEGHVQSMWLCLFTCLGDLCVDPRPPVRKSACHTLLQTVTCHGHVLQSATWQHMIWNVLFPMVQKVRALTDNASTTCLHPESLGGENMLIHHSRDTESKQWAESCVHTLQAVIKVFTTNSLRPALLSLDDFSKAWVCLLTYVESACAHLSHEISLAALKNIHEILLGFQSDKCSKEGDVHLQIKNDLWMDLWKVWLNTAALYSASVESTPISICTPNIYPPVHSKSDRRPPSPQHTCALLAPFPLLFARVNRMLDITTDLPQLASHLRGLMALPVSVHQAPFILPTNQAEITPAQQGVLLCVSCVFQEVICHSSNMRSFLPSVILLLLDFCSYAVYTPNTKLPVAEWVHINSIAFAEQSMRVLVEYYGTTAHFVEIINAATLNDIVKVLGQPLALKHNCPSQTSWKLAASSLQTILRIGLPIARQNPSTFTDLWRELASVMDKFLFPKTEPKQILPADERKRNELIDCQMVDVLKCEVLPYVTSLPSDFVSSIINTLNKGSISTNDNRDVLEIDKPIKLRPEFSRACFDALLSLSHGEPDLVQCSANEGHNSTEARAEFGGNAIRSLVTTCKHVLRQYVIDERASPSIPLPQQRVDEMCSVLNAVTTLVEKANTQPYLRKQVCELYPCLVECVPCHNGCVKEDLCPALMAYKRLIS